MQYSQIHGTIGVRVLATSPRSGAEFLAEAVSRKHLKLVDRRGAIGASVRELRNIIRGIDSGEIVSLATVFIRRDGSLKTYFDCECPIKVLGSVELLKNYIQQKKFELK